MNEVFNILIAPEGIFGSSATDSKIYNLVSIRPEGGSCNASHICSSRMARGQCIQ